MKSETADYHDLIENYLEGNLTEQENRRFQELLSTNAQLAEQYKIRITMGNHWAKAKEYGETRQSIHETIVRTKMIKKNRLVAWSVAASLLVILSVSGIVLISDHENNLSGITLNSDETGIQAVPQIKQAEEKASIHIMGHLKLIKPNKSMSCNGSDSIVFKWESDSNSQSHLIISNEKNEKIIYREKINLVDNQFILEKNFLPAGKYTWKIEGFDSKEQFEVIHPDRQNK